MTKINSCSFCGTQQNKSLLMIQADDGSLICKDCVEICYDVFNESPSNNFELIYPDEMKDYLDEYVVGQDEAKRALSVAVYNHGKRLNQPIVDGVELSKSNCIIIGSSGSGKTLLIETLAKKVGLPLYVADATGLTESGYVGDDVQNILAGLIFAADGDIELAEKGIIFIDEIDKKGKKDSGVSISRDVSGEGVQQALLKIIEGSDVRVQLNGNRKHPNAETVPINTKNILFIVGGAFVGMDKIIESRINTGNSIGFNTQLTENKFDISLVEPEDFIKFGIIPELVGRLPNIIYLKDLTNEQMKDILTKPKNSIVNQYMALFSMEGISLEFSEESLNDIIDISKESKTGARGLRTIIEKHLTALQFAIKTLKTNNVKRIVLLEGFFKGESENYSIEIKENKA